MQQPNLEFTLYSSFHVVRGQIKGQQPVKLSIENRTEQAHI